MLYLEENNSAFKFFSNNQGTVTLCGSTKFFKECMEINRLLTFKGWIVLMCGSWGHSYHKNVENKKTDYALVKKLHFIKIAKSDAIVVVSDKTNYIGNSTKAEIEFSKYLDKPTFYFDGENLTGNCHSNSIVKDFALEKELVNNFVNQGNSLGI
jgi:hypothetical protein